MLVSGTASLGIAISQPGAVQALLSAVLCSYSFTGTTPLALPILQPTVPMNKALSMLSAFRRIQASRLVEPVAFMGPFTYVHTVTGLHGQRVASATRHTRYNYQVG